MQRTLIISTIAGLLLPFAVLGQDRPAQPPAPARYRVLIRYHIIAPRDPHVLLYDALVEHLKSLDFAFIPPLEEHPKTDREDQGKNMLEGTIDAGKVRAILQNPSVAGLLLAPPDFKMPDGNQPVGVRLDLVDGLPLDRQRLLADQIRVLLGEQGFREATEYDHRGVLGRPFSRLEGVLPADNVPNLLKDLRRLPTGWLATKIARNDLPLPLRNMSPIRIAEVVPYTRSVGEPAPPAVRPALAQDKIDADLWARIQKKYTAALRFQLVLAFTPDALDRKWQRRIAEATPLFFLEQQLGPIVTGIGSPDDAARLAQLDEVSVVRLPPRAAAEIRPATGGGDNTLALRQSGLARLHEKKQRGKGVRLAIVDTDFRGWEDAVKDGKLARSTRLVDLTTARNPTIDPDPFPGDPKELGHGTQCALAAALAAPEADLVLLRVDVTAGQLLDVVRHLRGEFYSEHLGRRQDELIAYRAGLQRDRADLLRERKPILDNFDDDRDLERQYGYLGPIYGWIFNPRVWIQQRIDYQAEAERQYDEREKRFHDLMREIKGLKGIPVVSCSLGWSDGYPLAGASGLSQLLEERGRPRALAQSAGDDNGCCAKGPGKDRTPPRALWFQSAGDNNGQSWSGLYRDADGNGVMEFAAAESPPRKGLWTRELNFLGWQSHGKAPSADLPAKTRLRLSMQWREPHDPDYQPRPGEPDEYLYPLARLRLVLLRQRDPDGKKLPADDLEVVAYSNDFSSSPPRLWPTQRLLNQSTFAVYEVPLEFTVEQAGRYALRVERQLGSKWLAVEDARGKLVLERSELYTAAGTRPPGAATLPASEKSWELRPRIFVQATDEVQRLQGRPVLLDYATGLGSIGTPADSRGVIAVGAANLKDRPQPYTSPGPPSDMELAKVPGLFMYDTLSIAPEGTPGPQGSSLATPLAAGAAATLLSSGMSAERVQRILDELRGKVFVAPGSEK